MLGLATLVVGCAGGSGETGELTVEASTSGQSSAANGDLVLQSVRIAASEIELEGGIDLIAEREAEMGPADVEIAVDGSPTALLVDLVDAGSYHTLEIEFTAITVAGTYQGESFTHEVSLARDVEFPLEPNVDVPNAGAVSTGLVFAVTDWFSDGSGGALDPRDSANHAAIEQNILNELSTLGVVEDETNDRD